MTFFFLSCHNKKAMEPKLPENTPPAATPPPPQPVTPAAEQQTPPPAEVEKTTQPAPSLPTEVTPSPPDQTPGTPGKLPPNMFANKKLLLIGGGIFLVILLVVSVVLGFASNKNTNGKDVNTTAKLTPKVDKKKAATKAKEASQTIVYGTWTSQLSVIRAVDTATNKITTLASLPLTVKKVSVLSNKTLLYIDNIDSQEYGQRISVYDTQQKQITTNIPAATGMSIADYVLSPNKQYLALWEVSLNPETKTLTGGNSAVYSVDLTRPSVVNKLYDEPIGDTSVHYPRAILNDGTVFADRFKPTNSQTDKGWENGLSVIDFDGTNQKDIEGAPAGTYGSQPVLSHDQKYLLFAGYDGANGDGSSVNNGIRQAVAAPDTIDIINTQTLQRFSLPNLPAGTTYAPPVWDPITDNPIITIFASTASQPGVYVYDMAKQNLTKLPFDATSLAYISQLPKGNTLIGVRSTDKANIGNLGDTDAYAFTQLSIQKPAASPDYLSVKDPFIQYITILPGNYFTSGN